MRQFVCGFFFNLAGTHVALIRKKRSERQKGLLNGIGGKIENDDFDADTAMVREFLEKTGVETGATTWRCFFLLDDHAHGSRVYVYQGVGDLSKLRTEPTEQEAIEICEVQGLFSKGLTPNLTWLIPLALATNFEFGEGWLNG